MGLEVSPKDFLGAWALDCMPFDSRLKPSPRHPNGPSKDTFSYFRHPSSCRLWYARINFVLLNNSI